MMEPMASAPASTQPAVPQQLEALPGDRDGRPIDLAAVRELLLPLSPQERLAWAQRCFGDGFALTTSFGIQAAVLLHMVSRLAEQTGLRVPLIWVDTGYLPAETYRYADRLCRLLRLEPLAAQALLSPARMEALHGRLWETGRVEDLELYHRIRKVEPLDRAFRDLGVTCWASGVRGNQTDHRRAMTPLDPVRQRWSLRPLLSWNKRDVYYYMEEHRLPQHPLFEQGYSTVGDWHSSAPDSGDQSGRATRFGGLKQECGIHLPGLMGEGI
jgi:phosphoadenosine phosphosulfate reductase